MAAKKAAAKKAPAKKSAAKAPAEAKDESTAEKAPKSPTTEMEGPEYEAGYYGVSQDDEDYSVAAEVARLSAESEK